MAYENNNVSMSNERAYQFILAADTALLVGITIYSVNGIRNLNERVCKLESRAEKDRKRIQDLKSELATTKRRALEFDQTMNESLGKDISYFQDKLDRIAVTLEENNINLSDTPPRIKHSSIKSKIVNKSKLIMPKTSKKRYKMENERNGRSERSEKNERSERNERNERDYKKIKDSKNAEYYDDSSQSTESDTEKETQSGDDYDMYKTLSSDLKK